MYVEINELGLRDEEVSYQRRNGIGRILLIGDSLTAGFQVPLEDTFGKILEQRLNDGPQPGEWEILNAAVNGFGTDNELLFYRLEGQKYSPDYVILGMYLANDIYNNSRELELWTGGNGHKPYFTLTEEGDLELRNYPVQDVSRLSVSLGSFLKKHFQLPRFISQVLRLRAEVPDQLRPVISAVSGLRGIQEEDEAEIRPLSKGDICDEQYTPEIAEAWEITKALLLQLQEEVGANGARLVVLVIPASAQVKPPEDDGHWYCDQPNIELANFLADAGIPTLDLLGAFRAHRAGDGESLYFERDFHLNEDGHRLAGQELYEFMAETLAEG